MFKRIQRQSGKQSDRRQPDDDTDQVKDNDLLPWQYKNGTSKLVPVQKSSVDWYSVRQQNVIGIDFGTSTLAVAYKLARSDVPYPILIQKENNNESVPTVLLVMKNGQVEIGDRALQLYCGNQVAAGSIFFEQVKLELHDDEAVSAETQIKGSDGEQYYVVEVIALILREVQKKLADYFSASVDSRSANQYKLNDFHWVLTVPVLWGERARDMMKEAAYMAGLCSDDPKWNELVPLSLKPSHTHKIPSIKDFEYHPERLSLVYEPDAAAAWCKQMSDDVKTMNDKAITNVTDNFFLTIDVGGGTIDITAHQVLGQERMKRINIPHGEVCGGTYVNQAFRTFLEKEVVRDDGFTKYLSGSDEAENKVDLLELVYVEFERKKKLFAERTSVSASADDPYMIQLPHSFATAYETSLKQVNEKHDDADRSIEYISRIQKLQISKSIMSGFFDESIAKLHECIRRARDVVVSADHGYGEFGIFYLVGGFAGCNLVLEKVRNAAYSNNRDGKKVKVLVPRQPELAVVKGACIYYDHPIVLSSDATYGIGVALPHDPSNEVHVLGTVKKNDEGAKLCHDLFHPIVDKGQELKNDLLYPLPDLTPSNDRDRVSFIQVYRLDAPPKAIDYVTGEDRRKLKQVAELKIPIPPEALDLPRNKRVIEVLLDFTGIEIKIFARFKHNGKRVDASIDFLLYKLKHL